MTSAPTPVSAPNPAPVTLDVFSDIACPWCSIGEAHLARAIAARPDVAFEVRWRPFQLQPGLPRGAAAPRDAFFEAKFGGREAMEAAFAHVAGAGAAAGVPFDFSRLAGAPNTADAHRMVLLGEAHGRASAVARALFDAYFAHGRDVGDAETLIEIAAAAGLPEAEARGVLAGDRFRAEVDESQSVAAHIGVSGVPLVVVGGRLGVSGAQPPEALLAAFDQAAGVAE